MEEIKEMSIDLETYSDLDIRKCGVYKYSESARFEILLFAVAINGGAVRVYDLAGGEKLPYEIVQAIVDQKVIKWAFNASFERVCLSAWLRKHYPESFIGYGGADDTTGNYLAPFSWRCTMVWAATMGLPLSLEGVGAVLGLEQQKMREGKELIRYFCQPCNPTQSNGGRTRNLPKHEPEKWALFKAYNERDVLTEMSIQAKLAKFPVPETIWGEYHLDQIINDRGIALDLPLVEHAITFDERSQSQNTERLKELTKLENPNSVIQMKQWLSKQGVTAETLEKKAVVQLLQKAPEELAQVLQLRQQLAKSSVKKYQAMQNAVCADGRARGMFMFYGANRTGRWAGRLIQLQNLPQNHMEALDEARELVRLGDYTTAAQHYADIPDMLSQLIRTAFIPKRGRLFYVADFSAIEARVLAHIAGEEWRSEVFREGKDIYCASASQMFHVPVEKHGVNSHLRQRGKVAELALGYGGSTGALESMGAIEMGLSAEELQPLVDAWRAANPNIVQLWWDVDSAVKTAVKTRVPTETHGIRFFWRSGMLFICLPSGRKLCYVKPRIGENKFGGESVIYEGTDGNKKWTRLESYGPKFVENIVQAISRDILVNAMRNLRERCICGHVHDELICECSPDTSLEEICLEMAKPPAWMPDLQLRADGYVTEYYKKD